MLDKASSPFCIPFCIPVSRQCKNLIKIYHAGQELWASDHDLPDWCSAKPRHRFVYQCLDNVKMYMYAKFDQNIPCNSRILNIFTKRPRPAEMMLCKASSPFSYQWLDNGKGSLTLTMSKCLWFSVKKKFVNCVLLHCEATLTWVLYDSEIHFHIKCFKDLIFWVNKQFYIKIYRNQKTFFKTSFPPMCQQKLLPVYVLPYFTHCMEVACWHKGGKGVQ